VQLLRNIKPPIFPSGNCNLFAFEACGLDFQGHMLQKQKNRVRASARSGQRPPVPKKEKNGNKNDK